jgi:RND family efflux transporter MFP subunit
MTFSAGRRFAAALAGVALLPAVAAAEAPAVAVWRPAARDAADYDSPGRLGPADPVVVRAPAGGVVKEIRVKPGDEVRKGDTLFECDWASPAGAGDPAAAAVRAAEEEWKRQAAALAEATKLSKAAPEELSKRYAEALARLKEPLDRALQEVPAALRAGVPIAQRDDLQRLYAALDRTVRLANARAGAAFDVTYEAELARLRPAVDQALRAQVGSGKVDSAARLTEALRDLRSGIDRVTVLSRARSKEGLEALAAERDVAAASLKLARDNLAADRGARPPDRVAAPVGGRVVRVGVRAGDRVEHAARDETLLCEIAPTDPVRVTFEMDEKCLERLEQFARGRKAAGWKLTDVPARLQLPGEEGFPHEGGRLEFVESRPDAKSGRFRCRASFPNADGRLTAAAFAAAGRGTDVRVRLRVGDAKRLLLVPRLAVLKDADGTAHVLVADTEDRVRLRTVTLAGESGAFQEVSGGMSPDDRVIVASSTDPRATTDTSLSPEDFVRDLRRLDLKPGTAVRPQPVNPPAAGAAARPKP